MKSGESWRCVKGEKRIMKVSSSSSKRKEETEREGEEEGGKKTRSF